MLLMVAAFVVLQKTDSLDFLTKPGEPTSTPLPAFISLDLADIEHIQFVEKNQDPVIISRLDEENWQINSPSVQITAGDVTRLLTEFNAIKANATLRKDLDGQAYGLTDPTYRFTFNMRNGSQKMVNIGNINPTQTGYYAQVEMDPIIVISKGSIDTIIELINTAKNPPTPTPSSQD